MIIILQATLLPTAKGTLRLIAGKPGVSWESLDGTRRSSRIMATKRSGGPMRLSHSIALDNSTVTHLTLVEPQTSRLRQIVPATGSVVTQVLVLPTHDLTL